MTEDPIIAEIRRYRAEHAKRHGHDLKRIWAALKAFEAESGYNVVRRKPQLLPPKVSG